MAQTIKLKNNNATASKKPTSLEQGEVAINLVDKLLFAGNGTSVVTLYTGTDKWFTEDGNANNSLLLGGKLPSYYATASALNGYATQAWVEGKKYITGITSAMVTAALGFTPYNSANFTKANIKSTLGIADWALAASKPSYAWSEITSKPTTLSGYGITDALKIVDDGNNYLNLSMPSAALSQKAVDTYIECWDGAGWWNWMAGKWITAGGTSSHFVKGDGTLDATAYLPLSGGTISGLLYIDSLSSSDQPLALRSKAADASGACRIQFIDANNAFQGYVMSGWGNLLLAHRSYNQIGVGDSGIWCSSDNGTTKNALIHSGNIGSYSMVYDRSLDSEYASSTKFNTVGYGNTALDSGWKTYGPILTFGIDVYHAQLQKVYNSDTLYIRSWINGAYTDWKTIAFTDSNVASATKLQTARTIWGQSFDGTGNVDGQFSLGGYLRMHSNSGELWLNYGGANDAYDLNVCGYVTRFYYGVASSYNSAMIINHTGNVLIGTTSDNGAKLQVSGNLTATGEVISSRRASSSDARLKDNINRLIAEDCLAMVRNLQPSSWDWKESGEHSMGFIAQDIEPLMPYAVTKIKDEVLGQRLNLQYDQFFAPVVGAIQCLDIKVENHETRLKRLETENVELKNRLSKYETVWQ